MASSSATLRQTGIAAPAPRHVAIIMDGNGRWAKARGLQRIEGHRQGAEAVRRTVKAATGCGIEYLTLYGFSSENWRRSNGEISSLMGLLRLYLRNEVNELYRNGVRFRVIGNREQLEPDIVSLIADAERKTAGNTKLTLILALSYGGRDELVMAVRRLAGEVAAGRRDCDAIDEAAISDALYAPDIPDPDLMIRTSGEKRVSNFLLWQSAYAEFVFSDTLWPDFGADDLADAIEEFHQRERRFGDASA